MRFPSSPRRRGRDIAHRRRHTQFVPFRNGQATLVEVEMSNNKGAPKTYYEFKARFPKLAEALDLTRDASASGPLDERTQLLVKLGVSIGAMRECGVNAAVRKALQSGLDAASIEQTVA